MNLRSSASASQSAATLGIIAVEALRAQAKKSSEPTRARSAGAASSSVRRRMASCLLMPHKPHKPVTSQLRRTPVRATPQGRSWRNMCTAAAPTRTSLRQVMIQRSVMESSHTRRRNGNIKSVNRSKLSRRPKQTSHRRARRMPQCRKMPISGGASICLTLNQATRSAYKWCISTNTIGRSAQCVKPAPQVGAKSDTRSPEIARATAGTSAQWSQAWRRSCASKTNALASRSSGPTPTLTRLPGL
mmetsp:Transcript_70532/g.216073  ORF Transcript_70532/g.216073 Transcript_70532/m.216073 type:complete len:245 (+) Transcript_70532:429-1163(+)